MLVEPAAACLSVIDHPLQLLQKSDISGRLSRWSLARLKLPQAPDMTNSK